MLPEKTRIDGFTEFVVANEAKLRHALIATLGVETGREAAAEAMAHGWEHWERVVAMENPVGYLFVVGRDRGRRMRRRSRAVFPTVPEERPPWFEPGLPAALAGLPEKERTVVLMLHAFQWSLAEVAETLGVAKGTVQTHDRRGMARLRRKLGVGR